MTQPLDMLDREINVGDYVVFSGNVYTVQLANPIREYRYTQIKIMLLNPSATTRPVKKYSKDCVIVPKDDIIVWMLKK